MTPARITIAGDYWDCQIYRGWLFLWTSNGAVEIVDWNNLVRSFIEQPVQELALTSAFIDGRTLYDQKFRTLFQDNDFKNLLLNKFEDLSHRNLTIDRNTLEQFLVRRIENPFGELHTDSEIFSNHVYGITYQGLFKFPTHQDTKSKKGFQYNATQLNDLPAYSIKADRYGKIALAGGSEGLFELKTTSTENDAFRKISDKHSSFADYSFISLYNSSLLGESFLALQKWDQVIVQDQAKFLIVQEGEISENQIFGQNGFNSLSWGTNEKIYRASGNILEVVNFTNHTENDDHFSNKRTFNFQAWKGRILKGGTAYFGTIIECENALVVLMGEDDFYNIPGTPTRWRLYPRSLNYENHLHVIQNNSIQIYSFNNDYFRSQEKDFGIKYVDESKKRNRFK